MESPKKLFGDGAGHAGRVGKLVDARLLHLIDAAEVLQQRLPPLRPDPGSLGQGAAGLALAAELPMVGEPEAVGLVPDPLEQEEGLAVAGQQDGR